MKFLLRFVVAAALLLVVPVASHAQFSRIGGGPSGAEFAGVVAGVAGATGLVLYFTMHKPAIVGCVQSTDGSSSLIDERDHRTYALEGEHLNLKAGERFKLNGKKIKQQDGKYTFRVKNVDHDYGGCSQ